MNNKNKEIICTYCQTPIEDVKDDMVLCNDCGTPYHKDCWDELDKCATYGCNSSSCHNVFEVDFNKDNSNNSNLYIERNNNDTILYYNERTDYSENENFNISRKIKFVDGIKKFFQVLGCLLYSTLISYLLWLGLNYLLPTIFQIDVFSGAFIGSIAWILLLAIPYLIFYPAYLMSDDNTVAKVFATIPLGIFFICSIVDPWVKFSQYTTMMYIKAVVITIIIIIPMYVLACISIWSGFDS